MHQLFTILGLQPGLYRVRGGCDGLVRKTSKPPGRILVLFWRHRGRSHTGKSLGQTGLYEKKTDKVLSYIKNIARWKNRKWTSLCETIINSNNLLYKFYKFYLTHTAHIHM